MTGARLNREFFIRDVLEVAPELLGLTLSRRYPDGSVARFTITETE
jgi:DNA-3-methyladenine glycosylase